MWAGDGREELLLRDPAFGIVGEGVEAVIGSLVANVQLGFLGG